MPGAQEIRIISLLGGRYRAYWPEYWKIEGDANLAGIGKTPHAALFDLLAPSGCDAVPQALRVALGIIEHAANTVCAEEDCDGCRAGNEEYNYCALTEICDSLSVELARMEGGRRIAPDQRTLVEGS